jgi:hypothetical protein
MEGHWVGWFISPIDVELELDNIVDFQMDRWKEYEIS